MFLRILAKLGGRKFLLALFGAFAIALHSWLGIDQDSVLALGGVIAAYVFGQGIADGFSGGATSSVAKDE
ncbi:MAG TPA: hypothetical protein VEJ63_08845 [Planctomycetota bacterium]|nr:hypothetical protein [Planctomycetota bacterium]